MTAGGALLAVAPSFNVALAGRLVSGTGGVLLMVSLPTIIMNHFAGARLSAAMGTLLAGYPVGVGLASAALPLAGSWRIAMAATTALAALALIGAVIARIEGQGGALDVRHGARLGIMEWAAVVSAGAVWGTLNAGFSVLLGFAAVFFIDQGESARVAGTLVSLVAFVQVPIAPFGGWLLGRLPQPLLGIAGGIALTSLAILLLPLGIPPAVALVLVGLAIGAVAGPVVALPAAALAPEQRAAGMGVFWLTFFLLTTALPPLAGLARDLTGQVAAPIYAAAVFMALGLAALIAYGGARRPKFLTVSAR